MFYIGSTIVMLILLAGFLLRRNRRWHVLLMSGAFVIDVLLVLGIEFSIHAVEKVVLREVTWITLVHVGISLLVFLLYGLMIRSGRGILKAQPDARLRHRNLSLIFLGMRSLNYVTSFMV